MKPKIMILLGSASDFSIAKKAINILETIGIPYDIKIASAHRTHEKVKRIVTESTANGVEAFLGIAGLSAHLPGMIAANTHRPVIGVPVDVKLGGLDALFASAQMPFGAPVATVGIDRGENGALIASQIIGVHDEKVSLKISSMRDEFFEKVQKDEEKILEELKGNYHSPMTFDIQNKLNNEYLSKKKVYEELDSAEISTIPNESKSKNIAVIAGSYSDIKIAKKTTNFLDKMKIPYDFKVISPVRYPQRFEEYLKQIDDVDIFIAITGLSAHVTGAIVAYTEKPVIGIPCPIRLGGLDSLLSMINMPPGVPVGTLGIANGGNGALFAAEILGIKDENIERDVIRFKGNINVISK